MRLVSALVGLLCGTLLGLAHMGHAVAKREADEALEQLRASDREWRHNDGEYRRSRQDRSMSEDAASEYAEFVAVLHRKMLESCQRFRSVGGDPDALGFACELPKQDSSPARDLQKDPAQVMTDREKQASLEAQLQESVHAFDRKLYERQEKLRTDAASQASGAGAGGRTARDGATGRSTASGTTGGRGGGARSENGEPSRSPDEAGQAGPRVADPGAGPGTERPAALRIPNTSAAGGSDDDVVARQLREAAEREQDPVMKEKLWDEYRKYKASKN
jgi:hypothetical protein